MFGSQRALLAIAAPLGAAAGALAVDHVPPATILATSALGCTAAGALALRPLRSSTTAMTRAVGGNPDHGTPTTTGTGESGEFVGRASGDDPSKS